MNYYEVILLDAIKNYDSKYTYCSELDIEIGSRVYVPFGTSNKKQEAIVIAHTVNMDTSYTIKEIKEVISGRMSGNNLLLIEELCRYYVLNPASILRLYFQKFKRKDIKRKYKKYYRFKMSREELLSYLTTIDSRLKQIPEFIFLNLDNNSVLEKPSNMAKKNFDKLVSDGVIIETTKIVKTGDLNKLTNEQKKIYEKIKCSDDKLHMIVGKNASGKTEIFFHLLKDVKEGVKLILVPELFQIPQLEKRTREFFGNRVAVIHSKMSASKQYDVERRILNGEVDIVIGTPISLFLNIEYSLIIIDECHEDSYVLRSPSLDVRKASILLSKICNTKVIFSSATPSLDLYFNNAITKHILNEKFSKDARGDMKIVDMREELINGNKSYISRTLDVEIKKALSEKKQVLLLMNKKGKNSFVSCRECGFVYKCDSCDLPYVHMGNNKLKCKLCSKNKIIGEKCPNCKSKYIKYFGGGIMKLEEDIKTMYPNASVLRVESRMFRNENSLNEIYSSINNGKYDIIIGTHIIAKALDVENIGLSAIISADSIMNISEYRAYEKAYQIISQLSGRSSRISSGVCVVQTYTPDSYIFKHLIRDDYLSFVDEELSIRLETNYPPFINHILLKAYFDDEEMGELYKIIEDLKDTGVKVSGIYQPIYSKQNNSFVYHILFSGDEEINYVKDYFVDFMKEHKKYRYKLEVDPLYLLY